MKIALELDTKDAVSLEVLLMRLARYADDAADQFGDHTLQNSEAHARKDAAEARSLSEMLHEMINHARHV